MLPQRLTVNLSAFQCGGAVKSARLASVNAALRSKKANVAVVLDLNSGRPLLEISWLEFPKKGEQSDSVFHMGTNEFRWDRHFHWMQNELLSPPS